MTSAGKSLVSIVKFAALSLILVLATACGPRADGTERRGWFAPRAIEEPLENLTAEQIYTNAEFELNQNDDPEAAAALFLEVERLHPYSEWAKRGLIMGAFAYHQAREYEQSRVAAQRFIDFYPADEDAAYAQYLLALTYYDQIDQVGRDQGITFQALQALRTVIEIYPDSEFANSAALKFDLAFDQLAAKEMEIGRYYLQGEHYTSAINRFRVVVEDFQTTSHTAEALMRLVEAYLALGLTDEAQTAGAILGYNFQSSPFYEDAFRQLADQDLTPEPRGGGWLRSIWDRTNRDAWL